MTTGIFGGTFDPVHNAHLAIARAALDQLGLQKILFIPTGPTRYRTPAVAAAEHRVAMLRLALEGEKRFDIDTRELSRDATGYTVDTLIALGLDKPTLLMGADQYEKLDSWHKPDQVRRLAHIAVVGRPGFSVGGGSVKTVRMPPTSVSSSEVRARAARGEDISALVPAAVANYIAEKGLYR